MITLKKYQRKNKIYYAPKILQHVNLNNSITF